ncbi:hypothetical protein N0V90_005096 [Kalmusia sp. IMI 367209]|nr:hypothetical protein N0V90_005096 [Kalmusia sp. IMI 367209]
MVLTRAGRKRLLNKTSGVIDDGTQAAKKMKTSHKTSTIPALFASQRNRPEKTKSFAEHSGDEVVDLSEIEAEEDQHRRRRRVVTKGKTLLDMPAVKNGLWTADYPEGCSICVGALEDGNVDAETLQQFGCPHEEYHRKKFADSMFEEEYRYLPSLNRFLNHSDPKWLHDIQTQGVCGTKLDWTDSDYETPMVSIRLRPSSDIASETHENKSVEEAARGYITSRGLEDIFFLNFELVISAHKNLAGYGHALTEVYYEFDFASVSTSHYDSSERERMIEQHQCIGVNGFYRAITAMQVICT